MNKIKTGGPAFPNTYEDRTMPNIRNTIVIDGMDLRDYFAAKVMHGLIVTGIPKDTIGLEDGVEARRDLLVTTSYEVADAMLKAREAK